MGTFLVESWGVIREQLYNLFAEKARDIDAEGGIRMGAVAGAHLLLRKYSVAS